MPSKTISCSTAKWNRLKTAICALNPVPQIPDPNSSDPINPDTIPEFTEAEWTWQVIKRYCARLVRSYEQNKQGTDNAPELDNDMITIT